MFEYLKEIFFELSERIKTKEMKLIENANNFIFIISLPSAKIKDITFELNEEQKNDKDKINDLNELIIKLNNEMNDNKKQLNELKSTLNKEIGELKSENKKYLDE